MVEEEGRMEEKGGEREVGVVRSDNGGFAMVEWWQRTWVSATVPVFPQMS